MAWRARERASEAAGESARAAGESARVILSLRREGRARRLRLMLEAGQAVASDGGVRGLDESGGEVKTTQPGAGAEDAWRASVPRQAAA